MTSTELTSVDMKPAFWNHRSVCYCVILRCLDITWKFWLMTEFVYLIKCLASRKAKELERKNHLEVRRVNHLRFGTSHNRIVSCGDERRSTTLDYLPLNRRREICSMDRTRPGITPLRWRGYYWAPLSGYISQTLTPGFSG